MSDPTGDGGNAPAGGQDGPNKAQAEFDRYKARLGTMYQPPSGMMPPWSVPGGGFPGWVLPGAAPAGPYGGQGASAGTTAVVVTGKLGDTLRLSIDLLNAALHAGTSALSMGLGGMAASGMHGPQHHDNGCGCPSCCPQSCGCPSCCGTLSCQPCCTPSVHGCC